MTSRVRALGRWLVAGVALLLAGCVSLTVSDTRPLSESQLEPPGSAAISRGGYRLSALATTRGAPDLMVLVAMSGGGKRSASFGHGALMGLRDVPITTPAGSYTLLDEVSGISGVSGGSFPAAHYGLYGDASFTQFGPDFLYQDTNSYIFGIYLLHFRHLPAAVELDLARRFVVWNQRFHGQGL